MSKRPGTGWNYNFYPLFLLCATWILNYSQMRIVYVDLELIIDHWIRSSTVKDDIQSIKNLLTYLDTKTVSLRNLWNRTVPQDSREPPPPRFYRRTRWFHRVPVNPASFHQSPGETEFGSLSPLCDIRSSSFFRQVSKPEGTFSNYVIIDRDIL